MSDTNSLSSQTETKFTNAFSEEVWRNTYKYWKDETIDDTLRRVAKAVASVERTEKQREQWEESFYSALTNFKLVPGGRVLANAGTEYKGATMINCYVGPRPKYDIDSLVGINKVLIDQALTLKSEGGWGMNFGFIRPRGAFIYGVGVETPGMVKYMELFDKVSEIVTAGSGLKKKVEKGKDKIRKGAMMAVGPCWHPDIEEFITAKQTEGHLQKFNMSVDCSTEFMSKVMEVTKLLEQGTDRKDIPAELDQWDLEFPETTHPKYKEEWDGDVRAWKAKGYPTKVYKTISAYDLWIKIMQSTYNRNEPGVLFTDVANKTHCWNYGEGAKILATNPCVTGDTLVYVADGRECVSFKELADIGNDVDVFCSNNKGEVVVRTMRHPRRTGSKEEVYAVTLDNGSQIRCTGKHKFVLRNGDVKEAKDLLPNDSLASLTRYQTIVKSPITNAVSKKQYRFVSFLNKRKSEHKIVAEGATGRKLLKGEVVHHKNYNSLDNSPENLEIMNEVEHNEMHRSSKLGDKNPMKRAAAEWSEDQWDVYKGKLSAKLSGDKNPKYNGVSNDRIKEMALILTKKLGRRFSTEEWQNFSKQNGGVEQFSKWRSANLFGSVSGLSKWAAIECGFEKSCDTRVLKTLQKMLEMGYDAFIDHGRVLINKVCEATGKPFVVPHERREVSISWREEAMSAFNKNRWNEYEYRSKTVNGILKANEDRKRIVRKKQAEVFTSLIPALGRSPIRKEWIDECKKQGVSPEVSRKTSPFRTYTDLEKYAKLYNHRVVSVEICGIEDVYNGTVDEFHNYFIGGFDNKSGFVNTLNCGEQSLPFGGCCNLASLNLTQFYSLETRQFNFEDLERVTRIAIRFSDNVNDYSNAPLPEYKESLTKRRRIGLGVMGWGSLLYLMKIKFGSAEAEMLKSKICKCYTHAAVDESINLAEEKGMFESCEPEKHADAMFWKMIGISQDNIDRIRKHGIRNSALFSIQPNGNTGILANVVSGGCEPVVAPESVRTVIVNSPPDHIKDVCPKYWEGVFEETSMFKWTKEGDDNILRGVDENGTVYKIDKSRGLTKEVECLDYAAWKLTQIGEWDHAAEWACTISSLTTEDHIVDMKGWYAWIDSSISKTVNLPKDYPFEKFKHVYLDLYATGIAKGLTTYRHGTMMSVIKEKTNEDPETSNSVKRAPDAPKRPKDLASDVHHIKVVKKGDVHDYLVIVGKVGDDPYEIFVKENGTLDKKHIHGQVVKRAAGRYDLTLDDGTVLKDLTKNTTDEVDSLTRMASTALRHGVPVGFVVSQLEKAEGSAWSYSKAMARALKKYIKDGVAPDLTCPSCGGKNMQRVEGCKMCTDCGYSACG